MKLVETRHNSDTKTVDLEISCTVYDIDGLLDYPDEVWQHMFLRSCGNYIAERFRVQKYTLLYDILSAVFGIRVPIGLYQEIKQYVGDSESSCQVDHERGTEVVTLKFINFKDVDAMFFKRG